MCLASLRLHELAGLGDLLDGVQGAQGLDVVGGGHHGLLLATDDAHEVLELHLVGQRRVDGGDVELQGVVPAGGAVVAHLVQARQGQGPLVPPMK